MIFRGAQHFAWSVVYSLPVGEKFKLLEMARQIAPAWNMYCLRV